MSALTVDPPPDDPFANTGQPLILRTRVEGDELLRARDVQAARCGPNWTGSPLSVIIDPIVTNYTTRPDKAVIRVLLRRGRPNAEVGIGP